MAIEANQNGDFYRQLSLLLKSGLPLPGSLRSLAAGFRSKSFRNTIERVADSVDSGRKLSDAMRHFPHDFDLQYVEIIEAGENNGTLAEALHEIGVSAQADRQVVSLFRDIIFYPFIVLAVLAALFLMLNYTTVYPLRDIYTEVFAGDIASVSFSLLDISAFIHDNILSFLIVYAGLFLLGLWLVSGKGNSPRIVLHIVRHLPGFGGIFQELRDARLCIFWSMMLKRGMSEVEIFPLLTLCIDDSAIKKDLKRIGHDVSNGMSVGEALKNTPSISPIIALTFRHVPEERIPNELEELSRIFLERASTALRRIAVISEVALTLIVSFCVLTFISSLFAPFIKVMQYLG